MAGVKGRAVVILILAVIKNEFNFFDFQHFPQAYTGAEIFTSNVQ